MSHRDPDSPELDALLDEAAEAWESPAPPSGFADRVLAARAEAGEVPAAPEAAPRPRAEPRAGLRSMGRGRAALLPLAAAAAAALFVFAADRVSFASAEGELVALDRTTVELGDRGLAVAEAGTALSWSGRGLGGGMAVEQPSGSAFYRVDKGGPFVVTTPSGRVEVTGTCFQVEVLDMNAVAKLPKSHFLSAASGAVLGAALMVTVYEGSVVLKNDDATLKVPAGEVAGMVGDRPVRGGDTQKLQARMDDVKAERDRLAEQVDELEGQLKTLMIAQANGEDPLAAENERLKGELERVKGELRVAEEIQAEQEGEPIPWPDDIPDAYRQEAMRTAVTDALKASGLLGDITSIDCSEFPCMVQGETLVEGFSDESHRDLDEGHRDMQAALKGRYPKEENDMSNSSWGDVKRVIDGKEHALRHFSISVYPDDYVTEENKADFRRRLRWRFEQLRDAMPME